MSEILPQIASARFPFPLIVEALDGEDDWRFNELFSCIDEKLGKIDTPQGDTTDFGSIPRQFWGIISPISRYRKPYATHDTCYRYQTFNDKPITQKDADDCLLRGMKERDILHNKICKWYQKKFGLERATVYSFLRMLGWIAWGQHTKELAKKK